MQRERDAEMKTFNCERDRSKGWKWLDTSMGYQQDILGHDAVKSAEAAFEKMQMQMQNTAGNTPQV